MYSLLNQPAKTVCLFGALILVSCTEDSASETGSLTVSVDPEDVIRSGLEPGDEGATIRDGWKVEFDKYLVTVGYVALRFGSDPDIEEIEPQLHVVDLMNIPSNGVELWRFDDLRPGRWEFSYELGGAAHGAERHSAVDEEDFEQMVESDWTYLVQGTLTKDDGESCPPLDHASVPTNAEPIGETDDGTLCYAAETVKFSIGITVETAFTLCARDGVSGVSVPTGGTQATSITIHGDHLFFNGFPEGSEGGVRRYAQWWANADLDLDGEVTVDELREIPASELLDDRFSLGGAPIKPVDNLHTYVLGQLKTQGHYQGEGECLVDGEGHDHSHEDEAHEDEDHEDEAHEDEAHEDEAHEDEDHEDGGSHADEDPDHADASAEADDDHDHEDQDHDHDDATDAGIAPGDAG